MAEKNIEKSLVKNDKIIEDSILELGYDKLEDFKKELDDWKTVTVKIAIIGQSGAGKSTFINKFRGLTPKDKNKKDSEGNDLYAKVGLTETTVDIKRYEFAENKLIKLYDLPGAGTERFPIGTYPSLVKMEKYDAFILLTKDRFQVIVINCILRMFIVPNTSTNRNSQKRNLAVYEAIVFGVYLRKPLTYKKSIYHFLHQFWKNPYIRFSTK